MCDLAAWPPTWSPVSARRVWKSALAASASDWLDRVDSAESCEAGDVAEA